ncbi:MAG: substrate-binding domain-containing protein [Cardiobacteriaceae bacterium]|nr:substrate-binding domain-containing protein [Cardiobacteriaceae bacterium]
MKIFQKSAICALLTAAFAISAQAQEVVIGFSSCCNKGDVSSTMDQAIDKIIELGNQNGVKLLHESALEGRNDDLNLQFEQIKKMIDQGAKAIIMIPVQGKGTEAAQKKIVDYTVQKKVPLIAARRPLGKKQLKSQSVFQVTSVANEAGIYQGRMIAGLWKANPSWDKNKDGVLQVAILKGKDGQPKADARTTWVLKTLRTSPEAKVQVEEVAIKPADWHRDTAKEITANWIETKLIDKVEIIIANSDDMALGAVDAFKAAGVSPIPIVGMNAIKEAIDAVDEGTLVGTVLQDVDKQAEVTYKIADNLARGKSKEEGLGEYQFLGGNQVNIPYTIITKENVAKYKK